VLFTEAVSVAYQMTIFQVT